MRELPENLRLKAVDFAKMILGVERPTQDHATIINMFTEFYTEIVADSTIKDNGKFDAEMALSISANRTKANPYFSGLSQKELDKIILARVLGMKQQYTMDKEYINARPNRIPKKYRSE